MKDAAGWYGYKFDASKITQGTIIYGSGVGTLADKFYTVLSPECDLANDKSDYVNLVAAGDLTEALQDVLLGLNLTDDHWAGLKALSRSLFNNVVKRLKSQINGQNGARWFFTPSDYKADGLPLLVFDLQQIYTVDKTCIEALLHNRKAILQSPFKESLVTRIYSYLTRVGTDDDYKGDFCLSILSAVGLRIPESPVQGGTAPVLIEEMAGDDPAVPATQDSPTDVPSVESGSAEDKPGRAK